MNDVRKVSPRLLHEQALSVVSGAIKKNPGLRTSQVAEVLDLPLRRVEDAIWELWRTGKIQMDPDSTLRMTRKGERVFRHFAP